MSHAPAPTPPDADALQPGLDLGADVLVAALELGAVAAVVVDGERPTGRIRWASTSAAGLLGWPVGALEGQAGMVLGLGPPAAEGLVPPVFWPADGPVAATRADGGRAQLRLAAVQVGGCTVLVLAPPDLDRQAADLLVASERRFQALAEQAPIGIISSEVGLRAGYANPEAAALLGVEVRDLLGTGWVHAVGGPDLHLLLDGLIAVLSGGELDLVVRRDGGQEVRVRAACTTLPTGGGGFVASLEDVTAARKHQQKLAHQATHDALTGLPNRALLLLRLDAVVAAADPACLAFIDLDGFKPVNDLLGHAAGDAVLAIVAHRLRAVALPGDTVARLGGDEFVVLRPGAHDPATLAEHLRTAVDGATTVEGIEVGVACSVGAVALGPQLGGVEASLRAADAALYVAKGHRRRRPS